ncbi:9619_t:CDS:1, partial [Racocetra persica]
FDELAKAKEFKKSIQSGIRLNASAQATKIRDNKSSHVIFLSSKEGTLGF